MNKTVVKYFVTDGPPSSALPNMPRYLLKNMTTKQIKLTTV